VGLAIYSLSKSRIGTIRCLLAHFVTLLIAWNKPLTHRYPDVSIAVLQSQRVAEAIQKAIESDAEKATAKSKKILSEEFAEKQAKRVVNQMKAKISNTFDSIHRLVSAEISESHTVTCRCAQWSNASAAEGVERGRAPSVFANACQPFGLHSNHVRTVQCRHTFASHSCR
jgi:hypothetical protein